jgi:hypothetical protein
MHQNMLKRLGKGTLSKELRPLADYLAEYFPEVAALHDLSSDKETVEAVTELLRRLWRWEN